MRDELLRRTALDALGPLGDDLAREVLERASLDVEREVAHWEGSHGTVHADRVIVWMPAELHARVAKSRGAEDELTRALSAALAACEGRTLYDLRFEVGQGPGGPFGGPYRDGA